MLCVDIDAWAVVKLTHVDKKKKSMYPPPPPPIPPHPPHPPTMVTFRVTPSPTACPPSLRSRTSHPADDDVQYMSVLDFAQGFGAVQLASAVPTNGTVPGALYHDHRLASNGTFYYSIYVSDPEEALSVTLAWYDPPSPVASYNVSFFKVVGFSSVERCVPRFFVWGLVLGGGERQRRFLFRTRRWRWKKGD